MLRRQALLRGGLLALMVAWAVVSLLGLPPLDAPLPEEASRGPLTVVAVAGVALYALASARYWRLPPWRPSVILIAVLTAFALLAEAMIAVALARNWHASWWEWHLLMAFAFAFVYYSAHVQYAQEGSWSSLFHGIYLQETIGQIRREHAAALEALVEAMQQPQGNGAAGRPGGGRPGRPLRPDRGPGPGAGAGRPGAGGRARADRAPARPGGRRRRARVIVDERQLLEQGVELTGQALRPDALRVGLVEGEQLVFPGRCGPAAAGEAERHRAAGRRRRRPVRGLAEVAGAGRGGRGVGGRLVLPLTVKDRQPGCWTCARGRQPRPSWLLGAQPALLGLENAPALPPARRAVPPVHVARRGHRPAGRPDPAWARRWPR